MSNIADETILDINSILYRKPPPLLQNQTNMTPSYTLKRPNSSSSSISYEEHDISPLKKIKREEHDITFIGSPRDYRRMRSDLLNARSTILTLESHIHEMHNVRKEMEILFDKEKSTLKAQVKRDRKSIDDIESQLQSIRKRESKLKDDLSEIQNKHDQLKIEYDQRVEELERNCEDLSSKIKLDTDSEDSKVLNLQRKLDEVEKLYELALDESNAHKNLANDLCNYYL